MKKQNAFQRFLAMNGATVFVAMIAVLILSEILLQLMGKGSGGLIMLAPDNLQLIIRTVIYTGIVAFGATLVIITGNIDLSVGSQMTMMCSLCALIMLRTDNAFLGIFGTILIGALCGLINGVLVSYLRLNSFITTLGTSSIFTALALMFSAGTILVIPDDCSAAFSWFGTATVLGVSIRIVWFVVVAVVLGLLLSKTVFGQRLYMIGANPTAARFAGIRYKLNTTLAYVITGCCCGLASVITMANVKSCNPQSASGSEMDVILCVVLGGTAVNGGKGSVWATVVGVLFYGVLKNLFIKLNLSTQLTWVVMGLIMIAILSMDALKAKGVKLTWKKK